MTELERYLAEEIAEDHVDGIITRREAMRRLGLMGVGATAAAAMITAEAQARTSGKNKGGDHGHGHGHDHGDGTVSAWAPLATTPITFPGPKPAPGAQQVTLQAAWAQPAGRVKGGVLVIHENRGLTDHIRNVAGRFAANGFGALALDLLSEEGGTAALPDDAARMAALSAAPPTRFDADMQAAITEIAKRVGRAPISAIGFCFGGGMIWRLLDTGDRRLAAAAPFYGPFPEAPGGDLRGIKANVLGVYAGMDDRVNATRERARLALEAARVDYEILTFTEAQHAFFNDTNGPPRFNPQAAEQAWLRVNDWFADADDDDRH